MTDDLLEKATRALRDTSAEPQPRSGLTRGRILDSAEKRYASRRSRGLHWIIAIATALAASTALAHVAQYWPEIKRALAPESAPAEPASRAKRKAARPQPPATPVVPPQPSAAGGDAPAIETPPAPLATPAPALGAAPEPAMPGTERPRSARPKAGPREHAPAAPSMIAEPKVEESPAPAPAVESAELALFRRAQRLHRARDPRALGAWDDYLRVADRGVLVPEARYNRALCLVRLGHKADARLALEPFARGEYGDYRRSEAAALLRALAD